MFRQLSSQTLIATLLIAGVCGAHTASAADSTASAPPSVRVSYRDLNLASSEGSRALYGRISQAAHEVCAAHGTRAVQALAESHSCVREAIASALARVQANQLAALTFPGGRRG
jgi:UrcA family protein